MAMARHHVVMRPVMAAVQELPDYETMVATDGQASAAAAEPGGTPLASSAAEGASGLSMVPSHTFETPELQALRLSGAPPPPFLTTGLLSTGRDRADHKRTPTEKRRRRAVHAQKKKARSAESAAAGSVTTSGSGGGEDEALRQERALRRTAEARLAGQERLLKKERIRRRRDVKRAADDARQDERRNGKAKARDRKAKEARNVAGAARHERERVQKRKPTPTGDALHSGDRKRQRLLPIARQVLEQAHGEDGVGSSGYECGTSSSACKGRGKGGGRSGGKGGGKGGTGRGEKGRGGKGSGGRGKGRGRGEGGGGPQPLWA